MIEIKKGIDERGVIIPLRVSISYPREIAMRARHRAIPKPQDIQALVDTGADCTLIDGGVVLALSLLPTGYGTLSSLDSSNFEEPVPLFDVGISFISGTSTSTPFTMKVAGKSLGAELPYKALVGRDLLQYCKLSYNGPENEFRLVV